jgi:hypothetical protein
MKQPEDLEKIARERGMSVRRVTHIIPRLSDKQILTFSLNFMFNPQRANYD